MIDPITKYILAEENYKDIDKDLDQKEKKIKSMPKVGDTPMPTTVEVLNRYMFEYVLSDDCPPDHTKDPQTGKCSKNPHDEEVEGKQNYKKGAVGAP